MRFLFFRFFEKKLGKKLSAFLGKKLGKKLNKQRAVRFSLHSQFFIFVILRELSLAVILLRAKTALRAGARERSLRLV